MEDEIPSVGGQDQRNFDVVPLTKWNGLRAIMLFGVNVTLSKTGK